VSQIPPWHVLTPRGGIIKQAITTLRTQGKIGHFSGGETNNCGETLWCDLLLTKRAWGGPWDCWGSGSGPAAGRPGDPSGPRSAAPAVSTGHWQAIRHNSMTTGVLASKIRGSGPAPVDVIAGHWRPHFPIPRPPNPCEVKSKLVREWQKSRTMYRKE